VGQYGGARGQTKFTYEGDDVLLDDSDGTQTKYLNGEGIDNKLRQATGSNKSYFLSDHLGSVNGLTDATGNLTASNSYDSFGNPTNTSFPTRYQYTGREFDSFIGLQYNRARWYDPAIGRFISEDPIGLAGGINSFAYVQNNPLAFTDGYGLNANDDEQLWRAQQDLIEALKTPTEGGIGFGDAVTGGVSEYIRRWEGIDDSNLQCSVTYQAGWWIGITATTVIDGLGLYDAAAELAARRVLRPPSKLPYSTGRPPYAPGQVEAVWEAAKTPSGRVFDPYTGEELFWDKSLPRNGQWDMGHIPEMRYRDYHADYMSGRISKQEFLNIHRDSTNYWPQSVYTNRSSHFP
jgi:RHS repeat-associated protein